MELDTMREILEDSGEVDVVMESGETYEVHNHNLEEADFGDSNVLVLSGTNEEGQQLDIFFDANDVEHIRRHYDV